MPFVVYKLIHYLGVFGLVAVAAVALGRRAGLGDEDPWRRRVAVLYGTALFLVLLGGFGMLARLGVAHGAVFPGWVWAKLAIWTAFIGVWLMVRKRPAWSGRVLVLMPLLAAAAGIVAFTKPF